MLSQIAQSPWWDPLSCTLCNPAEAHRVILSARWDVEEQVRPRVVVCVIFGGKTDALICK